MEKCDVLVIGGGGAGVAAAVSAARMGARTVLVERGGSLGGMASAALVHSICGLYFLPELQGMAPGRCGEGAAGGPATFANPGFAVEFAQRLMALGRSGGPVRMGRVDVLLQHPTAFARTADGFAAQTPNLEVRFHSELLEVDGDFRGARIIGGGRSERFSAGALVDASGDGAAAALGGAPWEMEASDRLQRPAFIFSLLGVAAGALGDENRLKIARRIAGAVQGGGLPRGALGAALRSSGRGSEAFVNIDLDASDYDPLSARCLGGLEMLGRELAGALADFLRSEVPGFQESFISAFPTRLGVRESRRILGRQRLEGEHLTNGACFEDSVALATWPMEMRETNRGPRLRYPVQGRACGIPLGALRGRDHEALFAAGRCMGASHEAQASIRVIGTCLATGEAAGIAAALYALGKDCGAEAVLAGRQWIGRGGAGRPG